jgi:alpha-mannosidase
MTIKEPLIEVDIYTIYIHCSNHFDPIWRRGFKKPFFYNNEKFVSSSVIQEACIEDWVTMSKGSALKFEIECSLVLRTYLEKHPEHLDVFKQLIKEGRFELLAAGEIIPDPNMPIGETLVRNLIYGLLWAEDTLGVMPKSGCVNDGFGASAQMPQIFRGCGIKWLTGLSYKFPTKEYWKGLDGTFLYIQQDFRTKNMKYLGRTPYYRPCPECHGEGCGTCLNRGFDHSYRMGMDTEIDASKLDLMHHSFGLIEVGGEESMVTMNLVEKVAAANASQPEYDYSYMLIQDLAERYKDDITAVDSPDPARVSEEIDGNPVSTGCLVSRIKTKQETRRLENKAESIEKWAALAYLQGLSYPTKSLTESWKKIAFAAFHDSITGTHIDVGYEELLELYAEVDEHISNALEQIKQATIEKDDLKVSVFNPHSYEVTQNATVFIPGTESFILLDEQGNQAILFEITEQEEGRKVTFRVDGIPGLSWKEYRIAREAEPTIAPAIALPFPTESHSIENEFYKVTTNDHGVIGIYDKRSGQELVNSAKGYANELVLEHDVGDPWTTRELNRPRLRLGNSNKLVSIERFPDHSVLTYRGKLAGNEDVTNPVDYRVMILEWEQKVIIRNGIPRVDFETKIDWDTFDRRIRISFPTPVVLKNDSGHYAIPYGTLTKTRYEMAFTGWENPNGDWAAVEWGSTGAINGVNVAIFNRGTPSYRIERGEILMSVLRSPTFPNCLLWPREYNAPVYDGMRDQGEHAFFYSLYSYEGHWQDSDVVKQAYSYNKPLLACNGKIKEKLPSIELLSNHTLISAMKKAERGNGTIIRLFEYSGQGETIQLRLPPQIKAVYETNLLEKDVRLLPLLEGNIVSFEMTSFKIATIKML